MYAIASSYQRHSVMCECMYLPYFAYAFFLQPTVQTVSPGGLGSHQRSCRGFWNGILWAGCSLCAPRHQPWRGNSE